MNENDEMATIGRGSEPGESENPLEESGPVCGLPAKRIAGLSRAMSAAHSENFAPILTDNVLNRFHPRLDCFPSFT